MPLRVMQLMLQFFNPGQAPKVKDVVAVTDNERIGLGAILPRTSPADCKQPL